MITKFSVLYVGQIELDNIGLSGTPADARRYPNERLVEAFATAKDIAQTMDDLGFYCLWTAEHHFQREGYEVFPNLILLSTWLATQTRRLKFGCAFNILPMWHPLRLAEDYAVADIVTDGRVILGVGRGYHTREVETFGAPMLDNVANKRGLNLMWFGTGKEDFLIATTRSTVELLKKHGFKPVFVESEGAHTWLNWRDYLSTFAPQLFQPQRSSTSSSAAARSRQLF